MIETERLILEPLSREHLEPWTRFMLDGDARAGLHTPEPAAGAEEAAAGLDRFAEAGEMYALRVRESGEIAGFSGFVPRTLDWDELAGIAEDAFAEVAPARLVEEASRNR